MRQRRVTLMTQAAMIAAIYVVLCLVFAPISYKEMQIRIAEALCILPYFTPAAIPGLFIGCLIANALGGSILLDVIGGSLATLLGALGTYWLRRKSKWLASIPPVVTNVLIVPFVLHYGYGIRLPIPVLMSTVGAGQCISCIVLGQLLLSALAKVRGKLFKDL